MEILPKNQIYIRVRNIIALDFVTDEKVKAEIREASRLKEDINLDSLDILELAFSLEEEFKIECNDDNIDKFLTVGDIVEFIHKNLSSSGETKI